MCGGGGGGYQWSGGSFTHTYIYIITFYSNIYIKPVREECASVQNMGMGWGGGGMTHKPNWTLREQLVWSQLLFLMCFFIRVLVTWYFRIVV